MGWLPQSAFKTSRNGKADFSCSDATYRKIKLSKPEMGTIVHRTTWQTRIGLTRLNRLRRIAAITGPLDGEYRAQKT